MKFEDVIICAKCWCMTTGVGASALAAGLTQLPKEITSLFGMPLPVFGLFCNVYAVMCGAAVAFMSGSFGEYAKARKNGDTSFLTNPNPPPKPGP